MSAWERLDSSVLLCLDYLDIAKAYLNSSPKSSICYIVVDFIPLCPFPRLPESLDKEDKQLYFQTADMAECLAGPGYNAEKLSIPYVPQVTGKIDHITLCKLQWRF